MPEPIARLDEIRALLAHLPGPDLEAGSAAALRESLLSKPPGSLGRLEELVVWLATWQARHPPRLDHPRTALFVASHGVAARGDAASAVAAAAQLVQNVVAGGAAANQLCRTIDADLRLYEMNLDTPTADIVDGPAMREEECARAIAYGMMAVEPGIDALAIGEMGVGNATVAAALCAGLFGGDAADWIGPPAGITGAALENERAVVDAAVARHRAAAGDPFELLRRLGGLEFAAMAGAILAARMGRVPVVLDGFATAAAAAVLHAVDPRSLDHCVAGHLSAEPGHARLLERLGKRPLLDLGIRLGEAAGATMALALLKAAAACHADMATSAEAAARIP